MYYMYTCIVSILSPLDSVKNRFGKYTNLLGSPTRAALSTWFVCQFFIYLGQLTLTVYNFENVYLAAMKLSTLSGHVLLSQLLPLLSSLRVAQ